MIRPNPDNPTSIIGLKPSLGREVCFQVSQQLFPTVTPQSEQNMIVILTPTYTFTDLHIDNGQDGLSAPLDECVKIWFTYPPTEKNLSMMKKVNGQKGKMIQLAPDLEGGLIFLTTSSEAIYLPAGVIHAVFTKSGGFLVSMDFTTRDSILPFSQYIAWNLEVPLDACSQSQVFHLYLGCLDVALSHQRVMKALECWISIEHHLEGVAKNNSKWQEATGSVWGRFMLMTEAR